MAIRGIKPAPNALKLIRGNPGKRTLPDPAKQVRPPVDRPAAPSHLSVPAKTEWRRITTLLMPLQLLAQMDRAALAAYCEAYGRWVQAERALSAAAKKDKVNFGLVIATEGGSMRQNPLVMVANKAMADMMRYCTEFGMTPSSRTRLSNPVAPGNDNPFETFSKPPKSGT